MAIALKLGRIIKCNETSNGNERVNYVPGCVYACMCVGYAKECAVHKARNSASSLKKKIKKNERTNFIWESE